MYQYPKNIQTLQQLIHKLENAGMIVESQVNAEVAFTSIGYYRLKGYCFHLYDPKTNKYFIGTKFNDVLSLYHFDSELSNLLFGFLSKIEIALRARLVNALLTYNDALILNDPSFFADKELYLKNQSAIASEIARSNDVFIKHNFDNHDGAIPLWAAVEVMSFGTLSKVVKTLKTGSQSAFSILVNDYKHKTPNGNLVNPSKDMFTSWVHAASIMRNICAHNSRIYNRAINFMPRLISKDEINPRPQYNGLYQIMLSMKYLRPTNNAWNEFIINFKRLLQSYSHIVELKCLNFPPDWEAHFDV